MDSIAWLAFTLIRLIENNVNKDGFQYNMNIHTQTHTQIDMDRDLCVS